MFAVRTSSLALWWAVKTVSSFPIISFAALRSSAEGFPWQAERERTIINLRFGLGSGCDKEMTQKEVANLLGISQSYISRLEKKIMKQLKKEMLKENYA